MSHQLLQSLGHCMKSLLQFYSIQRSTKLRHIEMATNKEEMQGLQKRGNAGATNSSHAAGAIPVPSDLTNPAIFTTEQTKGQQPLQTPCKFHLL